MDAAATRSRQRWISQNLLYSKRVLNINETSTIKKQFIDRPLFTLDTYHINCVHLLSMNTVPPVIPYHALLPSVRGKKARSLVFPLSCCWFCLIGIHVDMFTCMPVWGIKGSTLVFLLMRDLKLTSTSVDTSSWGVFTGRFALPLHSDVSWRLNLPSAFIHEATAPSDLTALCRNPTTARDRTRVSLGGWGVGGQHFSIEPSTGGTNKDGWFIPVRMQTLLSRSAFVGRLLDQWEERLILLWLYVIVQSQPGNKVIGTCWPEGDREGKNKVSHENIVVLAAGL